MERATLVEAHRSWYAPHMLVVLQALAFAGCVLLDMLPSTEVQCRFDVPLVTWPAPPPVGSKDPAVAPEAEPAPDVTPTGQPPEGVEQRRSAAPLA